MVLSSVSPRCRGNSSAASTLVNEGHFADSSTFNNPGEWKKVRPKLWYELLLLVPLTITVVVSALAFAQEPDPEETREAGIVARFVTVLEKNPRRGTALDKVYGFHVERGTLDTLIATYRETAEAAKGAAAGPGWMIVGLLESLRGQDAESVAAFAKAEQLAPANYLASYYLGQALVLVGQPDKAAEALERAAQRKPAPADQLEIFQALGRVYQRAQKNDKALEVWNRLEQQFPNDARVQEQIASTLLEEGEFAAALPRFEQLAKSSKDKYRQSLFQMEAAEIKVRLGQNDAAIHEFEKLLSQLNPDNWLFREVRRRIENVYLRTDDQAGLIAYYEAWTKKNAEDLEVVSRLARLLSGLGRGAEAQAWLEKGLKVAPTRKELRNALIAQLVYEQKYPEAIAQYELLDKYEPNNPDTLRDWGRLILKDTTRDEAIRMQDAARVWRRLTTAKPKDPLIASQVAELFRYAEMTDEALALYRRSIELAPEAAQYKEYLGEYFHSLERKEEALATWRTMVDGKARTAANVARLAEVLAGFGYLSEAVETNAEACKLDPKEINLQIKQVDLLSQAEQHEEALKQLAVVQKLAANDEEREAWLQRELKELQALNQLKGRIAAATQELQDLPAPNTDSEKLSLADKWFWLARANEAERQLKSAAEAVTRASELAPQSIPILMSSARILESQSNLLGAVETNTRLAAIDRRYRTEYLKKIAQLEVQLGRRDKALQAGKDLLAAAPGNPELYEFFSQLCFQLGENDEGLQALRRSVRVNPTDPKGLLLLASALSEQFRTSEAIELYWRAFEKAGNLDDRLTVVPRLTELYLQTNQFDRLLERLERLRREPNQQRELTICLAQAYQSAGDDGNARQELEKLLTEETRDTQLLQQLVRLCEQDGDLDSAVRFQQQLNRVAAGKEGLLRLAQLLAKAGEEDDANALMTQISVEEKDPEQQLRSLDALLTQKNYDQATPITARLVRDQPKNWELLYRDGVALAEKKPEEATRRFEALLALNLNDNEQSLAAKSQAKKNKGRTQPSIDTVQIKSFVDRAGYTHQIQQAIGGGQEQFGHYPGYYPGQQQSQPFWGPTDFGLARMASLGWLQHLAQNSGQVDQFLTKRRELAAESTDFRVTTDWFYLMSVRNDSKELYAIMKKLSFEPDATLEIKANYLGYLSMRGTSQEPGEEMEVMSLDPDDTDPDDEEAMMQAQLARLTPLDNDELEHVLKCYRDINAARSGDGIDDLGENYLDLIVAELKRAGRTEDAAKLQADAIESARTAEQIAGVLSGVIARKDYPTASMLLDRLTALKPTTTTTTSPNTFNYQQYLQSPEYQAELVATLMAGRAKKKEMNEVLALWDRFLKMAVARYDAEQAAPNSQKRANQQQQYQQMLQYGGQMHYQIWRGNSQDGESLAFPTPNDFYNHSAIQMLLQTFTIYQDADAVPELLAHFQEQLKDDKSSDSTKLFLKLGLGYLHWMNDDKDEALSLLTQVAATQPGNQEMIFELARMHEVRGDPERALELIESLQATDQQSMQRREISALRLSVNSGNIDRARLSAGRLFGLRLDTNLQLQLARQMHQLGMHEQAEAVLARAGRQAGNKTDVLMTLMQQYQAQGKNDVATQIAFQLLRRSTGNSSQRQFSGISTMGFVTMHHFESGENAARQQALQVLKRSGKLPEMIQKVEDQLAHSPKSRKLLETLIEYCTADGNEKRVKELALKYTETKSDDPQFQYQLAMQLMNSGKLDESLDHFRVVLQKQPRLIRNNIWEIQNAFESADKLTEYASLYDAIDFKTFRQNPYELTNLIENMSHREKTKNQAILLFKKAWEALPDQRANLLSSLDGEIFWTLPEIYDYARQGIIPTESSLKAGGAWAGFGRIQHWTSEGRIATVMTRFLTVATQAKKLDELATEVEQAQEKFKNWQAGTPLLALIDLHRDRVPAARAALEKLLTTMKGPQIVGEYTHWEIAQELLKHESCINLAIQYLEAAVKNRDLMRNNDFDNSPAKLLVATYKNHGRREDGRKLLHQIANQKDSRSRYDQQYESYRRIRSTISMGNEFRALGYPVDAVRLYQRAMTNPQDVTNAQRWDSDIKKEMQTGFQAALTALKPESISEILTGTVETTDGVQSVPVDLILMLESHDLSTTTMNSVIVKLMTDLVTRPGMIQKTKQALAEIRTKRPDDMAALILAAQASLAAGDTNAVTATVSHLVELVDRAPLEPAPAQGGFTSKQREIAGQQAALWLVARDCLKQDTLRPQGEKLAQRALEASRRNPDPGFTLAILREWGQIALTNGDRETAERLWTEMLQIVLPKPTEKSRKPEERKTTLHSAPEWIEQTGQSVDAILVTSMTPVRPLSRWEQMIAPMIVGQFAVPTPFAPAATPSANPVRLRGNVVTLPQFQQAAQIARMASENGFADLSIKAVAQSLHSGPPIESIQDQNIGPGGFPVIAQQESSEHCAVIQAVVEQLIGIEYSWRTKKLDDETIYQTLKHVVLPDNRPLEVFLYPRPLSQRPEQSPQSVGLLLVQAAARANKLADLKAEIEPRLQQPLGELPARILYTQIALAAKDNDTARAQLEALAERLKQDSLQYSSELACHVAVPAMSLPDLPPTAVELLERAVEHFAQNVHNNHYSLNEEPMRTFRFSLARFHFKNGTPEAGKKHLEDYLAYLVPLYRRYGGDYGVYRRRLELIKIAAEYSRANQQSEALDCLGQHADLVVSRNYGDDGPGRAGAMVLSMLAKLPAEEQYALLKAWSLPVEQRKSVRVITALVPEDHAPGPFDRLRGSIPRGPFETQLFSTAELLVNSAREVGKLEELRSELQPHAAENVENAPFLLLLTRIVQGDAAVAVDLNAHLEIRQKALSEPQPRQQALSNLDAILARSAQRQPSLVGVGRQLVINHFQHLARVQNHLMMALMRHEYNASVLGHELASRLDREPANTGFKYWTAGATASARTLSAGALPMWWISHEGLISHICGPDQSHLYFIYPLTGSFELSCDAWLGSWAEANHGYGGLSFEGLNLGNEATIYPVGNRADVISKANPQEQQDRFNRIRLKVQPDGISYFVNGQLIHTEPCTTATSPWFFLQCDKVWQSCFRDIRITGNPVVPRQVQLSQGDSLLGWCTDFYDEKRPTRDGKPTAVLTDEDDQLGSTTGMLADEDSPGITEFDWWSKDGVIQGRIVPTNGFGQPTVQQSRLYYNRPLLNGEQIRYEFWYEAGVTAHHVHPAFDRLVFLLDPDGVKTHWMTDGSGMDDVYGGLLPENVLEDKSVQRGKVTLKDQDWNAVEIAVHNNIVTIFLNDSVICERPLEFDNNRQFGFYHDKHATAVKVRNVVMTGDWPRSLTPDMLENLTAPTRVPTAAERQALGVAIEEKFHGSDLDSFLLQTRKMAPQARYQALQTWIFPGEDHSAMRLYGTTAPCDPLPVMPILLAPVNLPGDAPAARAVRRRQRSGGELIAPVLDLVAVARDLGKLAELAETVAKIPDTSPQIKRSRLAIQVLIAIASHDLPQAQSTLKELTPARSPGLPDTLSQLERWPELIVATEASRIPELRKAAIALFDVIVDSANRKGIGTAWDVKVRSARQHALLSNEQGLELPVGQVTSPRGQWSQSTQIKAATRAQGIIPSWRFSGTDSVHLGGDGNDLLYFQSPLRGTFTIEGDVATFGWRETSLMYGTEWAGPNYTLQSVDLGNLYTSWNRKQPPIKFDPLGDWFRLKVEVTPQRIVYSANGKVFQESPVTATTDPWLAIRSTGQYAASTRSLRITGQPEIPAELHLSKRDDLHGWWADTYSDPMNGNNPSWKKVGEEIIGRKTVNWAGRQRESLLQYHRPMLEDGEITYDFFYIPNPAQAHQVHPALGQMVMLLDPAGVKIHWLTAAQFERGGLAHDNSFDEPEHRRGPQKLPLKNGSWNKLALNLKEDVVSLTLNDTLIFERPLDPGNSRTFGLFHTAGETRARIKNVIYRGNWPKSLPPVNEQELARNDLVQATLTDEQLPARISVNFETDLVTHLVPTADLPTTRRSQVDGGVLIIRSPNTNIASQSAGYQSSQVTIGGDFEVTLGYRNFQSTTQNSNHQVPRVEIILAQGGGFGAPQHSGTLALTHRRHQDQSMTLTSILGVRRKPPDEDWQTSDQPATGTTGKLRIVRRDGTVYYLYSTGDSADWQILESRAASTADIKDVVIGLRSEDLAATASVVLTDFSIRATRLIHPPAPFAENDLPAKLSWNFQGPRPAFLRDWATYTLNSATQVPEGIKITRPAKVANAEQGVGYALVGGLAGDFEVTLDYRAFQSTRVLTDWRVPRMDISASLHSATNPQQSMESAAIAHRRNHSGDLKLLAVHGKRGPDGKFAYKTTESPTDQDGLRLRLVRQGSSVFYQAARNGTQDWTTIDRTSIDLGPVKYLSLGLRAEDLDASAEAILTNVTIRAKELLK
ncbi:MAG: DUF1583 domain-containing protein [Planctomycetes bacterium]|nr:DUF1583 domain-containing protein [Planctomycetota bacterium]